MFVAMFQVNLSLDQSICLAPKISIEMISDKEYNFELSTSLWISSQPLEQEPYEQQTVYVGESRVAPNAGEGLFAKRKIPEGMLFVTLDVQKVWVIKSGLASELVISGHSERITPGQICCEVGRPTAFNSPPGYPTSQRMAR